MNLCSPPTLNSNISPPLPTIINASAEPSALQAANHLHPVTANLILSLNNVPWNSSSTLSSKLKEHQTILINNQQAVRQVLTTMVLPPNLATHLAPLYSLFNLSPVVALPPHPLNPQSSPTDPPLNIPPPSAEAPASASDVLSERTHSFAAPISPQDSVEHLQTLSPTPILQHHSPTVSSTTAPSANPDLSSSLPDGPPPPPPPAVGPPLSSVNPPLSYAQATTRENHRHQLPTSTSPQTSTQTPTSLTFQASILSMSPPERLATLLQPSTTPLRTPQPVSSLIVQVQLSRLARERPTWSACRAIEAQSSYPILDANILPGLHPVPLFEIFFRTTYLEPLRTVGKVYDLWSVT